MSFGFSPTDVINLVQVSARVYVAFKDANDNSEAQVKGLVREFTNFHRCLLELSELMQEYGKPLPFPYLDFQETLKRCEETIEPYASNLVDRKMSFKKVMYIIKYIGKENEIDNLRSSITCHYQSIQMCISFLQLRLHLEATKQTQRLLDRAPFRAMSFGGQHYTTNAIGNSSHAGLGLLPAPSEADQLYKDWQIFSRWLKKEDERLMLQGEGGRPLSFGATPSVAASGDEHTAAVLYHLRRELEDAIMIEENRAKRVAVERSKNLSPSDAVRQEMRDLPPIPSRTYTLDTEHSGNFSRFDNLMSESTATIREAPASPSSTAAPSRSPEMAHFQPVGWGGVSPHPSSPGTLDRTPSMSTVHSSTSTSPGSRLSVGGLGISTAGTTPEDAANVLRPKLSVASLVSIALGPGALQWNKLCKKVDVERASSKGVESRECDLHWRYREDTGISIRSVYRSGSSKEVKIWITQHFPSTGPSIPLTTTHVDGEVSIEFPRASFGRLDKRCTDIKYTVADTDASTKLQTLLYTNNGKDKAELLYDRPVRYISSNLNKPECRGKNVRLWRRSEVRLGASGLETVDVLFLLFYTSALPEEKGHWVEEPSSVFQKLDESVYRKQGTDRLQLKVSKEPSTTRDRMARRRSSRSSHASEQAAAGHSADGTNSIFGGGRASAAGSLNRFGYGELEISFQSKEDGRAFVDVWGRYR
ncbi:hypothetical protein K458DRAFT_395477 [Lentithecium fluviatile CBS 122367]|uniref:Uncharacterized protein n=1 Tax=Lentithecium fluviatile CBS 122367 TaxID=1168545 RepID=A0A6G1IHY1_9PLEO|nr:hypothetical protein K458DRAFT_395477 [Lentithecium fluviatile CBS 122367]